MKELLLKRCLTKSGMNYFVGEKPTKFFIYFAWIEVFSSDEEKTVEISIIKLSEALC